MEHPQLGVVPLLYTIEIVQGIGIGNYKIHENPMFTSITNYLYYSYTLLQAGAYMSIMLNLVQRIFLDKS